MAILLRSGTKGEHPSNGEGAWQQQSESGDARKQSIQEGVALAHCSSSIDIIMPVMQAQRLPMQSLEAEELR